MNGGGGDERETAVLAALAELDRIDRERAHRTGLLDTRRTLRAVAERVRAEHGFELSLGGLVEGPDLVLRAWSGTRHETLHDLRIPLGLGLGGRVVAVGSAVVVRDYYRSSRITHDFDPQVGREAVTGMVGLPIGTGPARGVLYGATRGSGQIGDSAIDGLTRLAHLATLAVDVADGAATLADAAVTGERRRIAAELHDGVGAMLFGLGSSVRDLRTDTAQHPELADRLHRLERELGDAAATLRAAVARLHRDRPADSDGGNPGDRLAADLAETLRRFEQRTGIPAAFVPIGPAPQLDAERAALLRRTVAEGLLNVEKHAEADSVAVTLTHDRHRLDLAVIDDGPGPDPNGKPLSSTGPGTVGPTATATGAGLPGLRARYESLGGSLHLHSDEDGTTLRGELPLLAPPVPAPARPLS
ncbi:GAF domain-containing sensor histidine kinase [Kitasatospora cheerisanensis]|uniref:Histidine kinase n=1 Tax=Kitasatospora cheerisanensis KCTC 2395 TaxID=1348663 RepID=A0A066YTQ6_9ACTN|nr:ATP-binding protein [Kitasatospora cheerisanensis]KDN81471.1 histidine kinase [Kitasatospora cheerisanensis KCTC 2395]